MRVVSGDVEKSTPVSASWIPLETLQVTMCCRTLLDPLAREVLKPTLLKLCRESFKQLLDKEKAAQAKQVRLLLSGEMVCIKLHMTAQSGPVTSCAR